MAAYLGHEAVVRQTLIHKIDFFGINTLETLRDSDLFLFGRFTRHGAFRIRELSLLALFLGLDGFLFGLFLGDFLFRLFFQFLGGFLDRLLVFTGRRRIRAALFGLDDFFLCLFFGDYFLGLFFQFLGGFLVFTGRRVGAAGRTGRTARRR